MKSKVATISVTLMIALMVFGLSYACWIQVPVKGEATQLPFTVKVLDHDNNPVKDIGVWLEPPWKGVKTDENGLATINVEAGKSVKVRISNVKSVYYGPYSHPQDSGGTMILVRLSKVKWLVTTETGIPVKDAIVQVGPDHFYKTGDDGKVSVLLPAAADGTTYTYRVNYAGVSGAWINVTVYYCQDMEIEYNGLVAIPVKVVDSGGNPVQGVTISREPGFVGPQKTDANGMVDWKYCPRGGEITLKAKYSTWSDTWTATIPLTGPVPGPIFQVNP
jgi:hypothetical protein